MLTRLYIKNFTLIDELDVTFSSGFSVITGETGAGKSIILGALGLLLGNRADSQQVKTGNNRCIIEAHFDMTGHHFEDFFAANDLDFDESDCIVRREITVNGKSRAFINDSPVTVSQMRELGEHLVDIHSQHQNLLLNKEDFQLNVVDLIGQTQKEQEAYRQAYEAYIEEERQLARLKEELQGLRDNEDYLRFQVEELGEAHLQPKEQESLEQQAELMSHAEDIKAALFEVDSLLSEDSTGIINRMRIAVNQLQGVEKIYPAISELTNRTDSSYIELKDIADDIRHQLETIEFDPRQSDKIQQRLDLIYSLEQKHHVETIDELIEIHDRLAKQLSEIDNGEENLQQLEKHVAVLRKKCEEAGLQLSGKREASAEIIEKEMRNRLVPLGIPHVAFKVSLTRKPLSTNGLDKVAFLFSANKGTRMQPVSEVASGGEIARVMLSVKAMISGTVKLPTIIFDEIDTGVSGRVAEQMATMMRDMGKQSRQVISITHLPQIAAMGSTHYKVMKSELSGQTVTQMIQLTPDQRVGEIAQMLSGTEVGEAAINNAKELLKKR